MYLIGHLFFHLVFHLFITSTLSLRVCIYSLVCVLPDPVSQVRTLHGIPALVQLFSSDNQAVQRYATGATRNLIYENTDNKAALVDAGGVMRLVSILGEPDEELRKTITGSHGCHITQGMLMIYHILVV